MPPTDCDCTIVPFRPNPPCFARCTAKILSKADPKQLTMILGLSPALSNKIVAASNQHEIESLEDYAAVLEMEEMLKIREVFKNLTQKQLDGFQRGSQSVWATN